VEDAIGVPVPDVSDAPPPRTGPPGPDSTIAAPTGAHGLGRSRADASACLGRISPGMTVVCPHDLENRGAEHATAFNVFIPGGGFEADFARWAS
jgi:hypothetical protein